MKRLTWVSSSKKKPANAKRTQDEKVASKDCLHRVESFLDLNTGLVTDERSLATSLTELGARISDHQSGAYLQMIGSLHQILSDLKLRLCNNLVENLQVPLRDHLQLCKDTLKGIQQGEVDADKIEKSRGAMLSRFSDYMIEITEIMKRCYEASADVHKASQEMKITTLASSIDSSSPPISPSLHRMSLNFSPSSSAVTASGRVFGRHLPDILDESHTDIPPTLEKLALWIEMNGMQTIGLFRIAGTASVVKTLRADIDSGEDVDFPSNANAHVMCSLFKAYLRELPEPLIPAHFFDQFADTLKEPDAEKQVSSLKELVDTMPKRNAVVLDWLLAFLKRVAAGAETTKMTAKSIASIISPNIMYKPTQVASLEDVTNSSQVIELLMEKYVDVFADITYATKSLDPLEIAVSANKNKSTHSDSLESSRRASDTDLIAPGKFPLIVDTPAAAMSASQSRRRSHRRIESDSSSVASIAEDAGFLSDNSPSRPAKRRRAVSKSSSGRDKNSTIDSSASQKLSANSENTVLARSPSAETASTTTTPGSERSKSSSSRSKDSSSKRHENINAAVAAATSTGSTDSSPARRLSSADKPRNRRGSDAGHRSRRGSKTVAPTLIPTQETATEGTPGSPERTDINEAIVPPPSLSIVVEDAAEQTMSSKSRSPSASSINAAESQQPAHVTTESTSPPQSPSTSDGSTSGSKDAARQRVSALLGTSTEEGSSSPKSRKSPGTTRMKAILDLVDQSTSRGDAIGGVLVSGDSITSSSGGGRRRSNSVADPMANSRSRNRDRTSGLTTLSFTDPEEFNSVMDSTFGGMSNRGGFVLIGYLRGNALKVQAHSVDGTAEEMAALLHEDEVQYGLLRIPTSEAIGPTIYRDIFIQWNGSNVSNIQKGVKKGHVGEIKEVFRPYNAEIFVVSRERLTTANVIERSNPQSGSHILD